jgi:DNA polymerase-3 subunit beta
MPAAALAEAVRRVALVAERGSSVRLSFEPGRVTIEAGTKGQARARETVTADFSGDETAIAFSPQYLLDGLAAALTAAASAPAPESPAPQAQDGTTVAKEGRIRLQFTGPTKPALITGSPRRKGAGEVGGESVPDYRYLVVPLRALASA